MEYARKYNDYNIDIVRSLIILYDKYDTTDKKSTMLNEFLFDKIPDAENADLFEQQADLLVRQNLVGDATSIFQKLIALFEASCNLLSKLAQCYRLTGSFSSALLCLEKCLKIEPNSLIINFQIAEVYFDLELFIESIQKYKEILSKYGENFSPARLALGEALYHMMKFSFEKALYVQSLDYCVEGLETLSKKAEETCIYYKLLGDFCMFLNNFSIEKLAILKNSTLFRYGAISKLGILQLGSKFYAKACQLAPEETNYFHDLALNLLKCYTIEKSNETLQKSRKCIEKAIVLNSKKSEFWSLLGCLARYEENRPENKNFTQNCFVRAVQIDERNTHAWTNLGLFYLETFPNVEIAHECFKKAQISDPKFCNAWIGQAIIAERVKSPQAPDLFRHTTSLSNHPESLIGYAFHALTALLSRQKVECIGFRYCIPSARDAIMKFVELHSDNACALNLCGLLCELNGHNRLATRFYEKSRLILEKENAKNDDFDFTACIDMVKENLFRLYRKLSKFNEASEILLGMKSSKNFPHMDAALIDFLNGNFEKALQNYDYSLYHTKLPDDLFYVTVAKCLCLVKIKDYEKALNFFVEKIGFVDERPHAKIALLLVKPLSKSSNFKLIKDCLSVLMNSMNCSELTKAVLNYLFTMHQDTQTCSWIMHKFPYLLQSRMIILANYERVNTIEYFNDVSHVVYSNEDSKTISNYLKKYATQRFISNFCHSNPDRSLIKPLIM
uniref:Tetratricopeptide repeat protein 37 n=1 Tax=Romanomermis culicivorax TaxID=13658 RepID=A0A915JUA4_ROMCU